MKGIYIDAKILEPASYSGRSSKILMRKLCVIEPEPLTNKNIYLIQQGKFELEGMIFTIQDKTDKEVLHIKLHINQLSKKQVEKLPQKGW